MKVATRATILVVEDDALIAMTTADMLHDLGHTVIEVASGQGALEVLERDDAVDLVMTDHEMPGMTGLELIDRIATLRPDLPVMLVTGHARLPDETNPRIVRLDKPYEQHQLAAALDRLLGAAGDGVD